MGGLAHQVRNAPEEFHRFIGAPAHRVFAVFDEPSGAAAALGVLRDERGLGTGDDVWVLAGEEGTRRLDLSGEGHGALGRAVRFFQQQMSSDVDYLRALDGALRRGGVVLAVRVGREGPTPILEVLRRNGGHLLSQVAHWDYVPVAA